MATTGSGHVKVVVDVNDLLGEVNISCFATPGDISAGIGKMPGIQADLRGRCVCMIR